MIMNSICEYFQEHWGNYLFVGLLCCGVVGMIFGLHCLSNMTYYEISPAGYQNLSREDIPREELREAMRDGKITYGEKRKLMKRANQRKLEEAKQLFRRKTGIE